MLHYFLQSFLGKFFSPYEFKEFIKQCYIIGYKSIPLVAITGFIMGLVLTLQSRPT
jgi:phospholipid/cholesterol/gamma-HCH transport system permease protein